MFLNTYAGAHQKGAQGHLPPSGSGARAPPVGSGTFSKSFKNSPKIDFFEGKMQKFAWKSQNSARKTSNIAHSARENIDFRSIFRVENIAFGSIFRLENIDFRSIFRVENLKFRSIFRLENIDFYVVPPVAGSECAPYAKTLVSHCIRTAKV